MALLPDLDEEDFANAVLSSPLPMLVDFHAEWCSPCKMLGPVVEAIAAEFAGRVGVGKLDTDANPGVALRYQVMGVPTLGLFHEGRLVDRLVGYPGPLGVRSWLERALARTVAPGS